MKKIFLGLAITAALSCSAVHAEDLSSNLSISGSIREAAGNCSVVPSVSSITVGGNTDELIEQGQHSDYLQATFHVNVDGDAHCLTQVNEGHISVTFSGQHDGTAGAFPVLANTDLGPEAAQGVGIGLFNAENNGSFNNSNAPINVDGSSSITMTDKGISLGMQLVKLKGQNPSGGTVHGALTIDITRL
ncbi:fimbrial protein [Cronobacter dublinensis]